MPPHPRDSSPSPGASQPTAPARAPLLSTPSPLLKSPGRSLVARSSPEPGAGRGPSQAQLLESRVSALAAQVLPLQEAVGLIAAALPSQEARLSDVARTLQQLAGQAEAVGVEGAADGAGHDALGPQLQRQQEHRHQVLSAATAEAQVALAERVAALEGELGSLQGSLRAALHERSAGAGAQSHSPVGAERAAELARGSGGASAPDPEQCQPPSERESGVAASEGEGVSELREGLRHLREEVAALQVGLLQVGLRGRCMWLTHARLMSPWERRLGGRAAR
jgi:hypothetical protein